MTFRDSHGKKLEDYPRPSVAVDTAVLTVADSALCVLLVRPDDAVGRERLRLPGTFLHPGERLRDSVLRSLREKAGVEGLAPAQLHVFDDPARDPRGWVLSVAHLDVVPASRLSVNPARAVLHPVGSIGELDDRHLEIVTSAVARLRREYRGAPDPHGLLASPFTLRELQSLHEVVSGEALMRDTFRRTMEPQVVATEELERGGVGKPARLFRQR
jgi:ADP-ribose pyrophosphatase YjhB (NUDIX family)